MHVFYKIKIDNLESIQAHALSKISEEDLILMPTRLFYPDYNLLDDPNLMSILDGYGLTDYIYDVALFLLGPNDISPIHVDGDSKYVWSLNIPLRHCENTRTNFYQSDQVPIRKKSRNSDIEYSVFNPDLCILLDTVQLTDPCLMNVSTPHQIHNPDSTQRTSICIRLKSHFDISSALSKWDLK